MNLETPKGYEDQMKKTLSRYNDDNELIFTEKDLLSSLSYWAIKQSPKHIPRNLETVLYKFHDHIKPYFEKLEKEDWGFLEMDLKTLKKFIRGNLVTIKEFEEWNLSELELRYDIDIDDDDRGSLCNPIVSMFSNTDPLFDFVDLDALVRNTSHTIYDENEKIK